MNWWQVIISAALSLLAVVGAFVGARLGHRATERSTEQRELAARREEWWRRFVWAAELTLDDSPTKRVAGLKLLTKLTRSELAQREECELLDVFQGRVLDRLLDDLPTEREEAPREPTTSLH